MRESILKRQTVVSDSGGQTSVFWERAEILEGVSERPEPPALTDEESLFLVELRDRLARGKFDLPPVPESTAKVMSLVSDESAEFEEITEVIKMDQVLAAEVFKAVNSDRFRGVSAIGDLDLGVARLGRMPLKSVLLGISMKLTLKRPRRGPEAREMARHGVACSIAAAEICERTNAGSVDDASLSGLLHDIGIVAIVDIIGDIEKARDQMLSDRVFNYFCDELHEEAGLEVAKLWNFPSSVCNPIAKHHSVDPDDLSDGIVASVALAELLCHALALGVERSCIDLLTSAPTVALGLTPGEAATVLVESERRIAERLSKFGESLLSS